MSADSAETTDTTTKKPVSLKTGPDGRLLAPTKEESAAAAERIRALLDRWETEEYTEPPGETEAFMRGIDSHRPDRPLFEDYY